MIDTVYNYVVDLVGSPVPGLEPVVYVISCVILLFLLDTGFALLASIIRTASGK